MNSSNLAVLALTLVLFSSIQEFAVGQPERADTVTIKPVDGRTDEVLTKKFSTYVIGDAPSVANVTYCVLDREWKKDVSPPGPRVAVAHAMFLKLRLAVTNIGKVPNKIANFALVDNTWGLHNRTSMYTDGYLDDFFLELNPGVAVEGYIVFRVPPDRDYWLGVSKESTQDIDQMTFVNLQSVRVWNSPNTSTVMSFAEMQMREENARQHQQYLQDVANQNAAARAAAERARAQKKAAEEQYKSNLVNQNWRNFRTGPW